MFCKPAARFSHNEFGADLDDLSLAAGRRLPVDELDRRLHEGFLWYPCAVADEMVFCESEEVCHVLGFRPPLH